jgi:hypothetical protein
MRRTGTRHKQVIHADVPGICHLPAIHRERQVDGSPLRGAETIVDNICKTVLYRSFEPHAAPETPRKVPGNERILVADVGIGGGSKPGFQGPARTVWLEAGASSKYSTVAKRRVVADTFQRPEAFRILRRARRTREDPGDIRVRRVAQ